MLQRPCAMLAFLLAGAVFVVIPASSRAQAQPPAQSLDGLWLTDGYGELIEFQGDELHWFEITQVSCVPAGKGTRKSGGGTDTENVFFEEENGRAAGRGRGENSVVAASFKKKKKNRRRRRWVRTQKHRSRRGDHNGCST